MNKGLKIILTVVFTVAILALAWILFRQITTPIEYDKEVALRENAVIEKIVRIRSAEQAFKQKTGRYTGSFDTLINFALNDSLVFERRLVDEDDSMGMVMLKRSGRQNVEQFSMPVRDTAFVNLDNRAIQLTDDQIRDMKYVPYAEPGTEFILNAAMLTTESKVVVPVFEAKAPYKMFMYDLGEQELINLIDEAKNVYHKYPGIMVGDVTKATNDAGNWE